MQAMVQKNWPAVEIRSTVAPHRDVRAWEKMVATPPPAAVTFASSWTAKRKARRRIHPPMAE